MKEFVNVLKVIGLVITTWFMAVIAGITVFKAGYNAVGLNEEYGDLDD